MGLQALLSASGTKTHGGGIASGPCHFSPCHLSLPLCVPVSVTVHLPCPSVSLSLCGPLNLHSPSLSLCLPLIPHPVPLGSAELKAQLLLLRAGREERRSTE